MHSPGYGLTKVNETWQKMIKEYCNFDKCENFMTNTQDKKNAAALLIKKKEMTERTEDVNLSYNTSCLRSSHHRQGTKRKDQQVKQSNKYEVDPPRLVLGSWKHKNTSKRKEKNKTKNKQTKQQRG